MVLEKGRSRKKRAAEMAEKLKSLKTQIDKYITSVFGLRNLPSYYTFPALWPVPRSGANAPLQAFTY